MASPATPASAVAEQQHPLVLYDAVWIRRHADLRTETYWEGIIEYLGSVDFADGNDWAGVRLTGASEGLGKNDGTVQGRHYFDAPPNCGLFVRQSSGVVQRRSLTKLQEVRLRRDLGIAVNSPSSLATTMSMTTTPTSRSSTTIMTTTTTTPTAKSFSQRRPTSIPTSRALKGGAVVDGKITSPTGNTTNNITSSLNNVPGNSNMAATTTTTMTTTTTTASSSNRTATAATATPPRRRIVSTPAAAAAEVTPTSQQRGGGGGDRPTMSPSRRTGAGQVQESSAAASASSSPPHIMSRCQAIITLFLAWLSIIPLLAVGAGLVYKPSLILHPDENDDNDVDPLEANEQYSFLILLAGGVVLGQAIAHIFLLLPMTGDACCCWCRCCFTASSYSIGIRPFSLYVSRMASLATAWTSLVLLTLTFWTLHQQFQREHDHHPNDNSTMTLADYDDRNNLKDHNDNNHHYIGWSNDTYVLLLTASATSLALSTLSLVVSLLPCYSSRRVSNSSHQRHHNNDQEAALRQPLLLQSSTPPRRARSRPSPRRVEGVV